MKWIEKIEKLYNTILLLKYLDETNHPEKNHKEGTLHRRGM